MTKELDKELEEAKATGEDSVSADPVTPAGGEPKKRRGDVKKKVDPKVDEIEDDVKTPKGKHDVGMKESIESIFDGEDLSEEFKDKATAVFEAAIHEKATAESERLQEEFEKKLEEEIDSFTNDLVEKVDKYLTHVSEQWLEENEVNIESTIKVEVAESLLGSLKGLVEDHNLDISKDEVDAVAELENRLSEQETKYNKMFEEFVGLKEQHEELEKEIALSEISEDLTDTEADRLSTLVEGVSYSDIDEFKSKAKSIKESYLKESSKKTVSVTDETEFLEEEVEDTSSNKKSMDESVNRYADALSRKARN